MDPRERADATLARARARGAYVVTPESAISPMDAASTLQIPRSLVSAIDRADNDPESTLVVSAIKAPPDGHVDHLVDDWADDNAPAITQEAATQSLASPVPRRPPEPQAPMSWGPPAPPKPAPPPEPEEVGGLIPTVKQPPANRSSLSQRLDG